MERMKFSLLALLLCACGGGGGSQPEAPFVAAENPALTHPWLAGYWVGPMQSDKGGPARLLQVQLGLGNMLDPSRIYVNASGSGDAYGSGYGFVSGMRLRASFSAMGYSRSEIDVVAAPDFNSLEGSYSVWLQAINGGPPFDTGRVRLVRSFPLQEEPSSPLTVSEVYQAGDFTMIVSIKYPEGALSAPEQAEER